MAKKVRAEEPDEDDEPKRDPKTHRRGPQAPRLSITLPESTRRKVRLAAAIADMTENEWAREILVTAASRTVKKHFPDLVR